MTLNKENITLLALILFSGALIFSSLINNLLLHFSKNLGTRKKDAIQIRWNSTSKPALGGISFYFIFLISFISMLFVFNKSNYFTAVNNLGVLATLTIAFLMGLADDAYDTKPVIKFLAQFICAIILILTGTKISCFGNELCSYTLTILWIIGIMNSVNMLDNMDAITAIVSAGIMLFISLLTLTNETFFAPISILAIAMLGTLIGFLFYNWYPSKMFMGDTGSQFLGIFLAILGINYCWNANELVSLSSLDPQKWYFQLKGFLVVACVFIIPISDTLTVVINRIQSGKSPFIGGKDHTTHFLFYNGFTEKKIALIFLFITLMGCYLSYLIIYDNSWNATKFIIYAFFPTLVCSGLFIITKRKKKTKK
jgi:UDP-GlcNAc:undecaprenyl-phosphate GlcNAc-1-phosphate transferase